MSLPIPWNFKPGVQRDGTAFASDAYSEFVWCRSERGLPRKMFGYSLITNDLSETPRQINVYAAGDFTYFHIGEASFLEAITINTAGAAGGVYDRTPVSDFIPSPDNQWQFDTLFDSAGTSTVILAYAGQNLNNSANSIATPYFIGDVTELTPVVAVTGSEVSGGIVVLQPYAFRYGDSLLAWSDANLPDTLSGGDAGEARVSGLKIIKGLPLRGNGVGPAGLFWSLNTLIRATYNGGTTIFAFDIISADISVMSADSITEQDGIFYWAGLDRFQMFNGVVREIPNNMNINFFFENLNKAYDSKIFVHKVPRFGEIWWCFPAGDSTECNWALILNVKEGGIWYDTPLPADFRSCSAYAQVYPYPVMGSDYMVNDVNNHCLWQHEIGVDALYQENALAIYSSFETSNMSFLDGGQNNDMEVSFLEWDCLQSGELQITVLAQQNARAPQIPTGPVTIVEDNGALPAADQVTRFTVTGRHISFKVESNTQGGDYQLGKVIVQTQPGGERITQ